jgi:hypothetical protein
VPNGVGVSLARNRRSPKRPSEPRPSGVHPEEDEVGQVAKLPSERQRCGVSRGAFDRCIGRSRWRRREHTIRTQRHQKRGRIMVFLVSDSQSVSSCVRGGFEHSLLTSRSRHSAANGSGNLSEPQERAIMCSSSLGQNRPAFTAQTRLDFIVSRMLTASWSSGVSTIQVTTEPRFKSQQLWNSLASSYSRFLCLTETRNAYASRKSACSK